MSFKKYQISVLLDLLSNEKDKAGNPWKRKWWSVEWSVVSLLLCRNYLFACFLLLFFIPHHTTQKEDHDGRVIIILSPTTKSIFAFCGCVGNLAFKHKTTAKTAVRIISSFQNVCWDKIWGKIQRNVNFPLRIVCVLLQHFVEDFELNNVSRSQNRQTIKNTPNISQKWRDHISTFLENNSTMEMRPYFSFHLFLPLLTINKKLFPCIDLLW